jgi:hypothetical protein
MRALNSFEILTEVKKKIRTVGDLKMASVYLQYHGQTMDMVDSIVFEDGEFTVKTENQRLRYTPERLYFLLDYNNTIAERNFEFHQLRHKIMESQHQLR